MTARLEGHVLWINGQPVEVDDAYCNEGEIGPGMMHRTRKVGFFRGVYEVAVIWSTGTYSSNATGLALGVRRAVAEFTDEPEEVEVGVARDGELLPVRTDGGESLTLGFVAVADVPAIVDYIAALPDDAKFWVPPELH